MDQETRAALKKKWPEKEGRSVDPAKTRIDHIGLMTQGQEFKPCPKCRGAGALVKETGEPATKDQIDADGKGLKVCPKCKGKGRVPTHDTLQEVWFAIKESYITQGNRLIVICTDETASKVDRERIRELEV